MGHSGAWCLLQALRGGDRTQAPGPFPHVISGWRVHGLGLPPVPAYARKAVLQMGKVLILKSWPGPHSGFATKQ